MTVSRRAVLGLAAAAAASVVAGCTRGSKASTAGSAATPGVAGGSAAASSSAPLARSSAARSAPAPTNPTPAPGGPARTIAHGPRTRAEVALTFHGAGDPAIARDLLAVLASHRAPVTVLAVGTWLAGNAALARQIVGAGHELGNHTYRHLDINSLGVSDARREISRCRDALVAAVGSPGAHFRQSQAPTPSALVRQLAGELGYPVCLSYDVDSLDYTDPGAGAVRSNVRAARPGSIVSLHFGHPGTVQALPGILTDLAGRGLRPVTASTLLRP